MHIEPGFLSQTTVGAAGVAASALLSAHAPALWRRPALLLRTLLAGGFFSVLMQAWHLPAGPSELHLVGAMPVYLLFGYLPTLFGFALGLLAQGLLFEPQDLVHLAVNALTLIVPLMAVHHMLGRTLAPKDLSVARLLQLDGAYYAGVTLMVGFWLSQGLQATALADWAAFAASYLVLVAVEPLLTSALVRGSRRLDAAGWARLCLDERLTVGARAV
ncbi:energy-coupling factor ABC transporter permease (plasmid) [Sphaerotilus sulfidivorans]|nr:cobalt transporter [Sphaerotilus natans]